MWVWFCVIPIGLVALRILGARVRRRHLSAEAHRLQTELDTARAELAALEALTADDRAWLARCDLMSDPTSYAMPVVGSVWEWQPGNPMAHEVVTVKETRGAEVSDAGSVWLEGPSGDRIVSLPDFAAGAVPAPLRHRR